ncbi:hypothetical protein PY650_31025 [Rhizobium calliandrae]|uniref:Metal-binding protein n=1 Tax=Rhizobium calliandrae TaxID=1312182 RepID=A0ABT7KRK1_9HYPH|nr:hypothetical protein [Rhizobium calliandrae]MDL2409973.1 hypothetical protein [Rhizobium calliandrae]
MKEIRNGKWFGICKLCGEEKPLCNAHLLPDSMKRLIVDFKSPGATVQTVHMESPTSYSSQTLSSDKKILCASCDAYLGKFDKKFVELLARWADLPARSHQFWRREDVVFYRVQGSIPDLFLGLLASLLRFSFSDRHPGIQLGPDMEKLIADSLLAGRISDELSALVDLKVLGSHHALVAEGTDLSRVIAQSPFYGEVDGANLFVFETLGLTSIIKIGPSGWGKLFANVISPVQEWDQIRIIGIHFSGTNITRALDAAIEVRRAAFQLMDRNSSSPEK